MMRTLVQASLAFVMLSLFAGGTAQSVASTKSLSQRKEAVSLKVDVIKNPFNEGECGCSLQLAADYKKRNRRIVFANDLGDAAQMNIDGNDVQLKQLSSAGNNGSEGVGSQFSETYTGGGYRVKVDYLTTKVCEPDDEQCETTGYSTTITVNHNGRTRKVKALGYCGC